MNKLTAEEKLKKILEELAELEPQIKEAEDAHDLFDISLNGIETIRRIINE